MTTDTLTAEEIIAKELRFADWDERAPSYYVELSREILAALESHGFVIVPREPTRAMIDAGESEFYNHEHADGHLDDIYRAMISTKDGGEG